MAETYKRYYWIKLKEEFFKDKKVKKLRKIAGGDTYTIIYQKLLLLSLADEGRLFYDNVEDTFADELALALDEDADNVRATLLFMEKNNLLQFASENEILLPAVPLLIGSESDAAYRMREMRARKKLVLLNEENSGVTMLQQCSTVLHDNETELLERDIEKELDKDKEIDTEIKPSTGAKRASTAIDYQGIVDMFNEICRSYPKVTALSDARRKAIRARLRVYTLDHFRTVFEKAEASPFLKGTNNHNWSATFDWMLKDTNFAKILDGNYDGQAQQKPKLSKAAQDLEDAYDMIAKWAAKGDD